MESDGPGAYDLNDLTYIQCYCSTAVYYYRLLLSSVEIRARHVNIGCVLVRTYDSVRC